MKIKMLMQEKEIMSPCYKFKVYGEDVIFKNLLQEGCENIGRINNVIITSPDKHAYCFNDLIRLAGLDPSDDCNRRNCERKMERLFSIVGFEYKKDKILFQDNQKRWLLTDNEKRQMVDFLKDYTYENTLYEKFLNKKERPENIARRYSCNMYKDIENYKNWLNGKMMLAKYVRMVWYLCYNRGLLDNQEIDNKFRNLSFDCDWNIELKRMKLQDDMSEFVSLLFDEYAKRISVQFQDQYVTRIVQDIQERLNYWMGIFKKTEGNDK